MGNGSYVKTLNDINTLNVAKSTNVVDEKYRMPEERRNEIEKEESPKSEDKLSVKSKDLLSYEFSAGNFYKFTTIVYIIQTIINKYANMIVSSDRKYEYNYDYNKFEQLIIEGSIIFYYDDQLFYYIVNHRNFMNKIVSNKDVSELINKIKIELKENNPLRNKHLYLYENCDGLNGTIKKRPSITFSDVILDEKLKSDIYDNTIFHLDNMNENNGVIIFGKPGIGKSLICSAIINEAIEKGYNTCYLCTKVNFESLEEFIKEFLAPCILVYEDIDSFGQDRKDTLNSGLSPFLQFINGLTDGNDKIVFVATTNYLEHLDDAIKDRPMRFNRKFEFKYPTSNEIDQLIELYFDKNISEKYSQRCYEKNFTGAHIKEIKRTATILSLKEKNAIENVFEKSVDLVASNFSTTLKQKPGFNQ